MTPKPSFLKCPSCNGDVEIWSDEESVPCPNCGAMVSKGKIQSCLDYCEFADKCKDMIDARKRERGELRPSRHGGCFRFVLVLLRTC